jgi:hypothetical protein
MQEQELFQAQLFRGVGQTSYKLNVVSTLSHNPQLSYSSSPNANVAWATAFIEEAQYGPVYDDFMSVLALDLTPLSCCACKGTEISTLVWCKPTVSMTNVAQPFVQLDMEEHVDGLLLS